MMGANKEVNEIRYSESFNLTRRGEVCDGKVYVIGTELRVEPGEGSAFGVNLEKAAELSIVGNIGCAQLECTVKGGGDEKILLFGFTQEYFPAMGEFCKVINYYLTSGVFEEISETVHTKCPTCGKQLIQDMDVCIHCVPKGQVFRRAFQLLGRHRKNLLFAGILLSLSNFCYAMTPYLNKVLIDGYLTERTGTIGQVLALCSVILLSRVFGEIIFICSSRLSNKTGLSFVDELRTMAYAKIQQLSITSLNRRTTGSLLKRVTEDTETIRNFITEQGRLLFEHVVIFLVIGTVLFTTHPFLAFMVFLPFPLVFYITGKFWRFIHIRYEKQWRTGSRSTSILHDIVSGIKVVKAFGNERRAIDRFEKSCSEYAKIAEQNEKTWSVLFPMLFFLVGTGEFTALYFGSKAVTGHTLTLGELVEFMMYIGFIYGPIRWLTFLPRWIADAATAFIKVFEIIDEKPEIVNINNSVITDIGGGVKFENTVFGYKAYEPVIKSIAAEIKPGEMVGLVGHSGSGKSTMINLILRLYDVNSGSLKINDHDIKNIDVMHLHENVGVVFQDTFLFTGSIYDNIIYTKPDADPEEVFAAAKIASAHEFIIKMPDGYDTQVGEFGHSLSGGERQRVAIARAILRNPSLLILDEATSSLDADTESKVQEAMQRIIKGRTTIAIAHKLSTLKNANRLFVLEKGKIAEIGTHKELLAKKGIYYNLVMAQLKITG